MEKQNDQIKEKLSELEREIGDIAYELRNHIKGIDCLYLAGLNEVADKEDCLHAISELAMHSLNIIDRKLIRKVAESMVPEIEKCLG